MMAVQGALMKKLLLTLSGARSEVLDRCPSERGKFEGIGGAVLTTSVLAVISMTFALHSALGMSLFLAIPVSLFWGLAIMSLDRWLVGTIQAGDPRRWRMAVPRVLMAVLIGVVISTPLVLRIFKSEIDTQIAQIKQDRASSYLSAQQRSAVGQEVARLSATVANLQKEVASGGEVAMDPLKDPKVIALTKERNEAQGQATILYDQWQCQLYGGAKCPRKGNGPLARTSKSNYLKAKSQVDSLNAQIAQRQRQLTATDKAAKQTRLANAKADLPGVQSRLNTALARQKALQTSFDASNNATNGILIRLQALNEVSGKNLTLRTAHILLFLLFLLIECLPVTVKLMQMPGNYEKILKLRSRQEYRTAQRAMSGLISGGRASASDPDEAFESGPTKTMHTKTMPPPCEPPTRRDDPPQEARSLEHEALTTMRDTRFGHRRRSDEFDLFTDG
jgi:hypothetical protein